MRLAGSRVLSGRFFYGWVIVAVMAVTGALSMALGSLNFGLFIKPMDDELGLGRAVFGWAQSTRQISSAVTAPVVGSLIDRLGVRALLTIAALLTGGALAALAGIGAAWHLVALFGVMGLVGIGGPGALVTVVPITKWFVRERGRALAFASLGAPIGGLIFMPLTQVLIDQVGWRLAWVILASLGAGVIIPLSLVFVRRQPEDLGLAPDGAAPGHPMAGVVGVPEAVALPEPADERSWTRAEALRATTYWRLVAVFSLVMLGVGAVGLHRIAAFMDRGLDPRLIAIATALDAGASGLSSFAAGLLARRIAPRFIGTSGFLLLAVASALTIVAADYPVMFASMILFGLGIGVLLLTQSLLWADYFGRRHLGSINGVVTPITLVFSGAGAPIAGYVRDLTGSYTVAWLAAIGLIVFGALLLAATPSPQARPSLATASLLADGAVE